MSLNVRTCKWEELLDHDVEHFEDPQTTKMKVKVPYDQWCEVRKRLHAYHHDVMKEVESRHAAYEETARAEDKIKRLEAAIDGWDQQCIELQREVERLKMGVALDKVGEELKEEVGRLNKELKESKDKMEAVKLFMDILLQVLCPKDRDLREWKEELHGKITKACGGDV